MPRHVLIVFSNAIDGRDEEYNRWYDEEHLGDVIGVDGFSAAQRFRLASKQIMKGGQEYEYVALYEIDAEDLSKAIDALRADAGTMVLSDAMANDARAFAFSAIGERLEA